MRGLPFGGGPTAEGGSGMITPDEVKKEPEEVAEKCVCGYEPIWSKTRLGVCYFCPNCLVRGEWKPKKQAVKSWNTAVEEARYRRNGGRQ